MGNWSMHIEGHGIHDNGKPEDADAQLREFAGQLARAGQVVTSATFHAGAGKCLPPVEDTGRIESPPPEYRPLP